jgi:hypothetical protein
VAPQQWWSRWLARPWVACMAHAVAASGVVVRVGHHIYIYIYIYIYIEAMMMTERNEWWLSSHTRREAVTWPLRVCRLAAVTPTLCGRYDSWCCFETQAHMYIQYCTPRWKPLLFGMFPSPSSTPCDVAIYSSYSPIMRLETERTRYSNRVPIGHPKVQTLYGHYSLLLINICTSRFPRSQTFLSLTKYIQKYTNIYHI